MKLLKAKELDGYGFIKDLKEINEPWGVAINEFIYPVIKLCDNFLALENGKRIYFMEGVYLYMKLTSYGGLGEEYTVSVHRVVTKYGIYFY